MSAREERAYLSRSEIARESNDHIAERAERLRFLSRVPMLCECDDGDCTEIVLIALDEYRRARTQRDLLAYPGHES